MEPSMQKAVCKRVTQTLLFQMTVQVTLSTLVQRFIIKEEHLVVFQEEGLFLLEIIQKEDLAKQDLIATKLLQHA